MYEETSRIVVVLTSIIITIGLYSQGIKIWKTRSAKDFSFMLIVALFLDWMSWYNYGFMLHEWPIILIGSLSFPGVVLVCSGYIKYRGGENNVE